MLRISGAGSTLRQYVEQSLLWSVLVGLVILPRVLHLDTFIGPDEKIIWGWGNDFALALSRGAWHDMTMGYANPAITVMWINTIGVGLKWLWLQVSGAGLPWEQVIGLNRPLELYAERRLFLSLANGLQVLAAYPLLRLLWDKRVAALAVGLMAIEPLYLAFGRMIRADGLLTGFMLLSVLSTLAFLKTADRRYNWLAGVMGGLAALSKLTGSVTAVAAVAIYAAYAWSRARNGETGGSGQSNWPGFRWWLRAVLEWGVPAVVVFFGLWPAWWSQPAATFNLLQAKIQYHAVDATILRADKYFWGSVHQFGPGPWFYPVFALLRLTPWLLLGTAITVGHWLWQARRPRSVAIDWRAVAVGFYIAVYWLVITLQGQKTDRYFVPVIPGLAVLAGLGIIEAIHWFHRRVVVRLPLPSFFPRLALIGIGLLIVGHVAFYHPLYSTYYNPLFGSPAFQLWALPVGNGEGVDEALKSLSAKPGAAEGILVCGTNFPRCEPFFAGELWHQEDLRSARWFAADYVLWHIDEQQMDLFPEGVLAYLRRQPPIYVARRHGIDYTWLYPVPQPAFLTGGSRLEGVATLFGYDISGKPLAALSPADQLRLHLYWQNEGQASQQRFWWRVMDSEGYVWSEGTAQPLPEFEAIAGQDGSVVEGQVALSLPPDMPPGAYYLKAGFADGRGDVGQFALPDAGSVLRVTGLPTGPSQPAYALDRALIPDLVLKGYDLSTLEGVPGETLWATLYWQAIGPPQHDYVISLRLFDEAATEVASWSGRPFHDTFPTWQWPAGANVRDPRRISLPPDLAPGQHSLKIELRDVSSAAPPSSPIMVDLAELSVVHRRANYDVPPMQFQTDVSYGEIAKLLGYDLLGDLSPGGAHVRVTLYWRALQATDQPYRVNLRLVGSDGQVLAEHESQPADGAVSTTQWQIEEIVPDTHEMRIVGSEPMPVDLEVRLLDAAGSSIPIQDGSHGWIVSNVEQKAIWRVSPQ